jgi:hypothetical protein
MSPDISAIERAFQIAKSGRVQSVTEIRAVLSKEGFPRQQLEGSLTLSKQLRALIKTALTNNTPA